MMDKNALSAFFDGEKSSDNTEINQYLHMLNDEADNAKCWQSYSLMRDVLRSQNDESVQWNIADKVAKAMDEQPAHTIQSTTMSNDDNVIALKQEQPKPSQARKTLPSWMRHLSQAGIAAAVSFVVIVGVQQYNTGDDISSGQPPVLQTIPLSGSATPVSLSRESASSSNEAQVMEQRRRINEIFQDYELQRRLNATDLEQTNDITSSTLD